MTFPCRIYSVRREYGEVTFPILFAPRKHSPRLSRTHPLEHLFPPNILQPSGQIPNPLLDIRQLLLIPTLDLRRLADRQIEVKANAIRMGREPTRVTLVACPEANPVFASVASREGEAALVAALLVHHAVVVIERLVDRNQQGQLVVFAVKVRVRLVLLRLVLACVAVSAASLFWGCRIDVGEENTPTTKVSLGKSSKKHFGEVPSM
jgi:hypothetical protein